jgi:hypothetical protein
MVREVNYEPKNETDAIALQSLFLKCYANIALANIKLHQFRTAKDACNEMLQIDPHNAKALYLRSQTSIIPKSSSIEEQEKGCNDLFLAKKYNPHNLFTR